MKKWLSSIRNLFYLIRQYWKYGKLYLLGRIILSLLVAPAVAFMEVTLIQAVIDAISAGATLNAALATAIAYEGALLGLTLLRWAFLLLYDRWKVVEIQQKINRSVYEQAAVSDYENFDNPEFYNNFTFASGELAVKSAAALDLFTTLCGFIAVSVTMTVYLATLGPWAVLISLVGTALCVFAQTLMGRCGILRASESLPFDRKISYVHRIAYQKQYAADLKSTNLTRAILSMFDKSGERKIKVFKKYV